MRPKIAKTVKVLGLLKIHKNYSNFLTTALSHYSTSDINTRCNFIDIKSIWLIIG